eukprot:TRINITY_DN2305_c0_g1_i2.p1 TRINITY_DN2305_c0_g1~~TRINITY_DN2305_c0_g1_i2.p1  ORF type:complete len:254 (-),score=72.67 TRINITY_DN2305_c0_g1_i2:82-843(-)
MLFYLYNAEATTGNVYDGVGELPVDECARVSDVKQMLSRHLAATRAIDLPPASMRLRDMYTVNMAPAKVFPDNCTIKQILTVIYNRKPIAIQRLTGPEPVTSLNDMVVYLQHWSPSTYTLSPRIEAIIPSDMCVWELRGMLAGRLSLGADCAGRLGIARTVTASIAPMPPHEVPDLMWDRVPVSDTTTKMAEAPLYVRDGDLLIFRDNTERLKVLSEDEKAAILKDAARSAPRTSYWAHKETTLKIHKETSTV